jgi:hypothetical protein
MQDRSTEDLALALSATGVGQPWNPSHKGFGEGWTGMALGLRKADEHL